MAHSFFSALDGFDSFASVTDASVFSPAPDDWLVMVADVVDSTQAVHDGRYKDVNLVGASFVAAALNATPGLDLPYMFGGDGAVALIPGESIEAVRTAVTGARGLAEQRFDLAARVGFVEIATLRTMGADVQVARFELSRGNSLAMFTGGGIELAEALVGDDDGTRGYVVPAQEAGAQPDLSGLSCRWEALTPRHGRVLCLLIKARSHDSAGLRTVYDTVFDELSAIVDIDGDARPVSKQSMRFKWPPTGLAAEAKSTRGTRSYWRRYLEVLANSLLQACMMRLKLSAGTFDAPVYQDELRANSDYRRFDGTLRMVLDCSRGQVEGVRSMLERRARAGDIVYGMHDTDSAMMTCLVFSLARSEHVHFVDGNDGGFWSAAIDLKQRSALVGHC